MNMFSNVTYYATSSIVTLTVAADTTLPVLLGTSGNRLEYRPGRVFQVSQTYGLRAMSQIGVLSVRTASQ